MCFIPSITRVCCGAPYSHGAEFPLPILAPCANARPNPSRNGPTWTGCPLRESINPTTTTTTITKYTDTRYPLFCQNCIGNRDRVTKAEQYLGDWHARAAEIGGGDGSSSGWGPFTYKTTAALAGSVALGVEMAAALWQSMVTTTRSRAERNEARRSARRKWEEYMVKLGEVAKWVCVECGEMEKEIEVLEGRLAELKGVMAEVHEGEVRAGVEEEVRVLEEEIRLRREVLDCDPLHELGLEPGEGGDGRDGEQATPQVTSSENTDDETAKGIWAPQGLAKPTPEKNKAHTPVVVELTLDDLLAIARRGQRGESAEKLGSLQELRELLPENVTLTLRKPAVGEGGQPTTDKQGKGEEERGDKSRDGQVGNHMDQVLDEQSRIGKRGKVRRGKGKGRRDGREGGGDGRDRQLSGRLTRSLSI